MRALGTDHSAEIAPRGTVMVWIESEGGSIARGVVEVLSEDGAFVQLSDAPELEPDAAVAVRLRCEPICPTLALAARVLWVLSRDETAECELEWMPGPDRGRLGPLIAALGEG
jgi:PilZ domain